MVNKEMMIQLKDTTKVERKYSLAAAILENLNKYMILNNIISAAVNIMYANVR